MVPVVMLGVVTLLGTAAAAPAPSQELETCLSCHGDPALAMKLPSGETVSLYVDWKAFAGSVHRDKLGCVECHAGSDQVPHPPRNFRTKRDITIAYFEQCKRCHFANYTKTLDSVHYARVAHGDPRAPVCSDCHSAHAVARPNVPRSRLSRTCATCHAAVFEVYARSVHGRALLEEQNRDVPVCTDCHRSHDIRDPRTASFQLETPALCGTCHTDERLMRKYGLSTRVVDSYLSDFHGMTASLRKADPSRSGAVTAGCTDCHGIHDITKVRAPDSTVMQAKLVKVCQRCHPDATDSFPAAWLGHYEPSPTKAPVVYAVTLFYWIFIPFVVGGLLLQILLHLWRVVVNR
jgi:predicted CXXCH cytochrome family protein